MFLDTEDTIAAVATPNGAGGIGVIRLSGTRALEVSAKVFSPLNKVQKFEPRHLYLGNIIDPEDRQTLDLVLCVYFKAPHSYTGEDVVEIQAHGGQLNIQQILSLLLENGARIANPGEFTLRAFLNGRIDLACAEAVQELIESKTQAALNASRRHLDGEITTLCENIKENIIDIMVHIEAFVDFPDEELEQSFSAEYSENLKQIVNTLDEVVKSYDRGRLLREGVETMILGLPNVGKSSLLNRLLRSEKAIVTDIPGTTRDLIEGMVDLAGVPVKFVDSAGLRDVDDSVEAIGVQKAWERMEKTDFVLFVVDGSRNIGEEELRLAEKLKQHNGVLVVNKCDLDERIETAALLKILKKWKVVRLSAKFDRNIEELEKAISSLLNNPAGQSESLLLTSARHYEAFRLCKKATERALVAIGDALPFELLAADLREALSRLDEIVGVTTPDDVLNKIFSSFCIGK